MVLQFYTRMKKLRIEKQETNQLLTNTSHAIHILVSISY